MHACASGAADPGGAQGAHRGASVFVLKIEVPL